VAGVPLDAAELTTTLTGCARAETPAMARAYGDSWLEIPSAGDQDLYLRRETSEQHWRLVAVVRRGANASGSWRADYDDWQSDVPHATRLVSVDDGGRTGRTFDLRLVLSQVEVNTPLAAEVFRVTVPRTATPITIDELRRSGPLAPR
jgi:hypothetical protein